MFFPPYKAISPKHLLLLTLIVCLPANESAQSASSRLMAAARQSGSLKPPAAPRAQVLVLGTFHFQDGGLDDYKPKFSVDVLSATRQKEIAKLLDSLARFKPTRIAVEWTAEKQTELDAKYREYLAGRFELDGNEIYQLGFRLGKRLGHPHLFAIDARQRWYDTNVSGDLLIQRAQEHKQMELLKRGRAWIAYFDSLTEDQDRLKTEMSIPAFLAYLNSPAQLKLALARYLVGQIEVGGDGDYMGADMRTAWYNRNLRIFSNIQRIPMEHNERVLVVVGSAHAPILDHLIENAPEYELVAAGKYLESRRAKRRIEK